MATYPVKYVTNAMRGAPQISGTAGSLIAALDAFLLTGFGATTAVGVTVAGGIATAELQAGQSFSKGCIVLVEGATPAALNGEALVLTASNTSITWATTAANGAASGTITIKVAPVGQWEKQHAGTNKAAYRSTAPGASGFCYRVDDTGSTHARVRGFESMSDIDTGSGPFPTDAQISGGGYLEKSYSQDSTAAMYALIADSRTLYVVTYPGTPLSATYASACFRGFGAMLPCAPSGDAYSDAISCANSQTHTPLGGFNYYGASGAFLYLPRPFGGIGGSVRAQSCAYTDVGLGTLSGADERFGVFPPATDGALRLSGRFINVGEAFTGAVRAEIPAVLHVPQSGVASYVKPFDILEGGGPMTGRRLLAVGMNTSVTSPPAGICLVDVTGPWR